MVQSAYVNKEYLILPAVIEHSSFPEPTRDAGMSTFGRAGIQKMLITLVNIWNTLKILLKNIWNTMLIPLMII